MPPASEGYQAGLMMDFPLTIAALLRRAAQVFPEKQIVSRLNDGSAHRMTYREFYRRVVALMNVLRDLGVRPGDRVATLGWNSHRYLELYFAVPCLGAILHTVNIRLFPAQTTYVLNHAEARVVFVDKSLAGLLTAIQSELKTVESYVVMEDRGETPAGLPAPSQDYEALLAAASCAEFFPFLDENCAAMLCYTSGTTGEPKGVLYSHRSLYLHAMGCCMADSFGIREREVVLPVVPMFHAAAWGLPYACAMTGATLVLPGSQMLGRSLAELMEKERVTWAAGVPTVWNLLYQHLKLRSHDLSSLKVIASGGAAASRSLIENYERDFGITVLHAWGMTETSPVGCVSRLRAEMEAWPPDRQVRMRMKQGVPIANVEMRLLGEKGEDLPCDGTQAGELAVRGPWVARSYYGDTDANAAFTEDGWFRTGDIATLDAFGMMEITDRKKDVIKSRGEWISSVAMENAVMALPAVLEAAVFARPDAVRGESPVVHVVLGEPEQPVCADDILAVLKPCFASWQLPRLSDIHFVTALPRTSVGKIDKKALRQSLSS